MDDAHGSRSDGTPAGSPTPRSTPAERRGLSRVGRRARSSALEHGGHRRAMSGSLSRRRLLELAGVGGVAAVAAGSGAVLFERARRRAATRAPPGRFRSTARNQAGILTPQQHHLASRASTSPRATATEVRDLLRTWTAAAARLHASATTTPSDWAASSRLPTTRAKPAGSVPSRLTLTFGFGPGLFDDRYGLAAKRPAELVDLPRFELDQLDPARVGRRPLRPGLRRRPAGRVPCDPQPDPRPRTASPRSAGCRRASSRRRPRARARRAT